MSTTARENAQRVADQLAREKGYTGTSRAAEKLRLMEALQAAVEEFNVIAHELEVLLVRAATLTEGTGPLAAQIESVKKPILAASQAELRARQAADDVAFTGKGVIARG